MKLAFFLGDAWLIGLVLLVFLSFSRWLFDKPVKEHKGVSPRVLLLRRLGISLVWPIALISGGGRRIIITLMKGE